MKDFGECVTTDLMVSIQWWYYFFLFFSTSLFHFYIFFLRSTLYVGRMSIGPEKPLLARAHRLRYHE